MAALIPSASATGSGTMTLAGPSTNSNQTITIPDATGTMMVSGNMPTFSAYAGSTLSTTNGTVTNMPCDTEIFDTNGCYNNTGSTVTLNGISTPAYGFAPNVAGYYQITAGVSYQTSGNASSLYGMIYKNGSVSVRGNTVPASSSSTFPWATVSDLVYCNGTSDYIQFYATQQIGTINVNNGASGTYFKAAMVRSA